MRNTLIGSLLLLLVLGSGCAIKVSPNLPQVGTIRVPAPAPTRVPPRAPAPRHSHRKITYHQAVSVGASYCADRGYRCDLQQAKLVKNGRVWKVKLDARSWRAKGKVHLDLHAATGRILEAKETGRLGRRRS